MSYITGKTIKQLWERKNMTQKELAKRINVSDKTINSLKDLSYTYFTVENIKYEMKNKRGRFRDRLTKENQQMIEKKYWTN